MNDTQRLDAIGKYGLCLIRHDHLVGGKWVHRWECTFNIDQSVSGESEREVIDLAVNQLGFIEGECHAVEEGL